MTLPRHPNEGMSAGTVLGKQLPEKRLQERNLGYMTQQFSHSQIPYSISVECWSQRVAPINLDLGLLPPPTGPLTWTFQIPYTQD